MFSWWCLVFVVDACNLDAESPEEAIVFSPIPLCFNWNEQKHFLFYKGFLFCNRFVQPRCGITPMSHGSDLQEQCVWCRWVTSFIHAIVFSLLASTHPYMSPYLEYIPQCAYKSTVRGHFVLCNTRPRSFHNRLACWVWSQTCWEYILCYILLIVLT